MTLCISGQRRGSSPTLPPTRLHLGSRVIVRTGVSELNRLRQTDFEAWPRRDLSALKGGSLFLDVIDLAARQGTDEQEGVLCASGMRESGQNVRLSLAPGSREAADPGCASGLT